MMHGHEKACSAIVAVKPTNAKGGDQGECGPAAHAPDSFKNECLK
jgi:hypothetical protein